MRKCKYCNKELALAAEKVMCMDCWDVYSGIKRMLIKVLAAILFDLREDLLK